MSRPNDSYGVPHNHEHIRVPRITMEHNHNVYKTVYINGYVAFSAVDLNANGYIHVFLQFYEDFLLFRGVIYWAN